jgi:1,4-alpha-glucan branching enzyme
MNRILLPLFLFPFILFGQTFNVTFQVDMNDYTGSFTTPEVNGQFNSWCGNCAPMSDPDGDNIWELVIPLSAGTYEYKFSADNWNIQENLLPGTPCTQSGGGFTNRIITVSGDIVLPAVCWESCDPCTGTPTSANVSFQVDMSDYTGPAFSQVNLNGTFNNWCGSCAVMTDPDGDNIYELTVNLPTLDTAEYKFTLDGFAVEETLTPGSTCTKTVGLFTNRIVYPAADSTLPAVCWESCDPCGGAPTNVDLTFRVDMREYTGPAYSEVNLNGTFNNWCGNCAVMSDPDGDTIYELTVTLPAMDSIEYKYTLDGFTVEETLTVGDPCTYTTGSFTNRVYVPTITETLAPVCWESCDPCSSLPDSVDVTFKVDMTNYTDPFNVVNLNGTFNGWCGGCAVMTDGDGDNVYELTVKIPRGDTSEYKYALDDTLFETLSAGSSCTKTIGSFTNRFVVPFANETLDEVCWESCDPCITGPDSADITFRVDMTDFTGTFNTVNLNGTFNGWCGGCAPMNDDDGDNIYELTIRLLEGTEIEYKYAVDDTIFETLFAGLPCTKTSGNFTNRVFTPTGDEVLPLVCWETCQPCGSVNPFNRVTFRLDMSEYPGSFTTPEVNGPWTGWCGNCTPMSDPDGDNIWEVEVPFSDTITEIEFKFSHDNWSGEEDLSAAGAACTKSENGFTNRYTQISSDTVLPAYCWEQCYGCDEIAEVTFRVDMSEYASTFTNVYFSGQFNDWCADCALMTDDNSDGIFELTTILLVGQEVEYKFQLDQWNVEESLTAGSPCTKTTGGFTNRVLTPQGDSVLTAVCWESCERCASSPDESRITFRVNMSNYKGSYSMVNLNGEFNSWCGSCDVMTDDDGDNIYEITKVLTNFDTIEYKFTLDGWTVDEQLTEGPCTTTRSQFINRFVYPTQNEVLPAYQWESCLEWPVGFNDINWVRELVVFPNPTEGSITLSGELQNFEEMTWDVRDIQGRLILSGLEQVRELNKNIDISFMENGIYILSIQTGSGNWTERIVLNR